MMGQIGAASLGGSVRVVDLNAVRSDMADCDGTTLSYTGRSFGQVFAEVRRSSVTHPDGGGPTRPFRGPRRSISSGWAA
ncbi:MAG: hypothetical protein L3K19_00975 [Thermoplasmata archaeon]|nr:hypothetical protein [Thermoplasmata archaeon]